MSIQFKKSVILLAAAGVFSLGLTGCGDDAKSDVKVIKVGVVGEYNVQWDTVNENLAADKLRVELVKYSDYATPNRALADKEPRQRRETQRLQGDGDRGHGGDAPANLQ